MTHLTPDEFVDAAEGTLDATRVAHLEACHACRREAEVLRRLLREARDVPVPEPSPLFWEHFSTRVREAVRAEGAPSLPWWTGWLRWPVLAPAAAVAALVMVLVATVPWDGPAESPSAVAAPAVVHVDDIAPLDVEWRALAELVGPLDWDTAGAAGLALVPGDAELAVMDLSDDERRALTELIAGELARAKS